MIDFPYYTALRVTPLGIHQHLCRAIGRISEPDTVYDCLWGNQGQIMEWAYCWRCDEEVAMLEDDEFSELKGLYDEIRTGRLQLLPFYPDPREYVVNAYEHMTGYRAKHVKAILYHRISKYGPPCPQCNLPLRTPRAKLCPKCGWHRELQEDSRLGSEIAESTYPR